MMVSAEWKEDGVWQETDPDLNACSNSSWLGDFGEVIV